MRTYRALSMGGLVAALVLAIWHAVWGENAAFAQLALSGAAVGLFGLGLAPVGTPRRYLFLLVLAFVVFTTALLWTVVPRDQA